AISISFSVCRLIDKITGCKKQRQIHQKLGTSSSAIRTQSRLEVGLGRTSKACLRPLTPVSSGP
ncbi:MAG: hypothetical protein ACTIDJ_10650, partial [Lactiplantibacillus plantarum]